MSFRPSQFSYAPGVSGAGVDQWMGRIYGAGLAEEEPEAPSAGESGPAVLDGPNPLHTVALASAKHGVDQLLQVDLPERPTAQVVEFVGAVGHVALGIAAFRVLVWAMTAIGSGVDNSINRGREPRGGRGAEAAA